MVSRQWVVSGLVVVTAVLSGCSPLLATNPPEPQDDASGSGTPHSIERLTRIYIEPLPDELAVQTLEDPHLSDDPEAGVVRFVRVPGTKVVADGVTLTVSNPLYVAVTELSNLQAAACLRYSMNGDDDLDYASAMAPQMAIIDDYLEPFRQYYSSPSKPAILPTTGHAVTICANLTARTGMAVRLPTLAEWWLALGVEGEISEDSMPSLLALDPAIVGQEPSMEELLQKIRTVNTGKPNRRGIMNIVGNVAELVFPTDEERVIMNKQQVADYHERMWYYTFLSMGGSVVTDPGWRLQKSIFDVGFHRNSQEVQVLRPSDCVGVRLVIEAPAADE